MSKEHELSRYNRVLVMNKTLSLLDLTKGYFYKIIPCLLESFKEYQTCQKAFFFLSDKSEKVWNY